MKVSIIIPAFNEEAGIKQVLEKLTASIRNKNIEAEIIVIDDGSTDGTIANAKTFPEVKVIEHPYNKGYGAAIKTGIRAAKNEWCVTYDADNQHTPILLDEILEKCNDSVDMIVGARKKYRGPRIRQPGKWLIKIVAEYLVERKIPDLNSGLRAIKRKPFLEYEHLFPDGFSLSTTSTVCFIKEKLTVVYVPIEIQHRVGKSTVRPRDAIKALMLIMRLIMLFSPLRIFLPVSLIFGLLGIIVLAHNLIIERNISDSAVVLLALTTSIFFFGLLADQTSAIRREIHRSK